MTRKHFIAFAAALASTRPAYLGPNFTSPSQQFKAQQWLADREGIMEAISGFNANFDRDRFITATEA